MNRFATFLCISLLSLFSTASQTAPCSEETLAKLLAKDFTKQEILKLCSADDGKPTKSSYAPPYKCDPTRGEFPDGICKPFPTEPNIPTEIRGRLYIACKQGNDVYNARTCCDHLTKSLAATLGVCPGPKDSLNLKIDWEKGLQLLGVSLLK